MFKLIEEGSERRQLRDSVAEFVRRESSDEHTSRVKSESGTQPFSPERFKKMAELGWLSALLPEAAGGSALSYGDAAAISEELGRGALTEPLVPVALLAARAIALGTNEGLKTTILPHLLEAGAYASLAWQAGPSAMSASDVGPSAQAVQDGWRLSGVAQFVPLAPGAQGMVVAARLGGRILLAWVTDAEFSCTERLAFTDGTEWGHITFDNVFVAADRALVAPEEGAALLHELLDTARLMHCAELLGAMQRVFEMTVAYLKQREQFGKPIGAFQALQHRAVDIYVQIELSRSALDRAIRVFDAGGPAAAQAAGRAAAVSAAKSRCGDAAMFVVKQGIQLHGAIAYTNEYALSLYIKRILSLLPLYGSAADHRRRYAALESSQGGA